MLAKFLQPTCLVLVSVVVAFQCVTFSVTASAANSTASNVQQDQVELMQQSLNDLMQELSYIKSEATNRLSTARQNRVASDERIRQTKVSKFILTKTSELEQESNGLKEELNQLFARVKRRQEANPQYRVMFMPAVAGDVNSGDNEIEGVETSDELEAREDSAQPESIRRVHEQSIVFVDRLVQNYLSNLRRAIDRMTRVVGPAPTTAAAKSRLYKRNVSVEQQQQQKQQLIERIEKLAKDLDNVYNWPMTTSTSSVRTGRQTNSPLWDRIPPRGTELWRDFWDTVRKQVRRINQEFRRISQDMTRLVTGQPRQLRAASDDSEELDSVAINRIDGSIKTNDISLEEQMENEQYERINVFDDQDDDFTRSELTRNVALRQQIQQEIGVFGSIFDMMQAFVRRLRETARNMVRDVLDPNGIPNNNNNAVTPGPDIKPQIDQLLEETIEAQRNINSQAKPVLLPNDRDRNLG